MYHNERGVLHDGRVLEPPPHSSTMSAMGLLSRSLRRPCTPQILSTAVLLDVDVEAELMKSDVEEGAALSFLRAWSARAARR